MADKIVVNSKFTQGIFRESFPSITQGPQVLYPGIHFDSYDKKVYMEDEAVKILNTQVFLRSTLTLHCHCHQIFDKNVSLGLIAGLENSLFPLIDLRGRKISLLQ